MGYPPRAGPRPRRRLSAVAAACRRRRLPPPPAVMAAATVAATESAPRYCHCGAVAATVSAARGPPRTPTAFGMVALPHVEAPHGGRPPRCGALPFDAAPPPPGAPSPSAVPPIPAPPSPRRRGRPRSSSRYMIIGTDTPRVGSASLGGERACGQRKGQGWGGHGPRGGEPGVRREPRMGGRCEESCGRAGGREGGGIEEEEAGSRGRAREKARRYGGGWLRGRRASSRAQHDGAPAEPAP